MKKGWMRAMVAVSAMLWAGAALVADARPCARILFEPMPRLMLYGDTTRLGPRRPGRFGVSELRRIFYKCSHPPSLRISK